MQSNDNNTEHCDHEADRDEWKMLCAKTAEELNEARQAVSEGRMTVEEFDERF